jgi:hypothetical protein
MTPWAIRMHEGGESQDNVAVAAPILVYSSSRSADVGIPSAWTDGGSDDGIIPVYSGGDGKYGGGGGPLSLALNGSAAASSISLSKLYLFKSPAMRSCLGVLCQLHPHRAKHIKTPRMTSPPRTMATIITGLR